MGGGCYYEDRKYCPNCGRYRQYLLSVYKSYCVECGSEVSMFSKEDWEAFNDTLTPKMSIVRPPKGGRKSKPVAAWEDVWSPADQGRAL